VRIGLAERPDETTAALSVVLPAPHALESWDDGEPVAGVLTVSQPLIRPFGDPRTLRECLAAWTGKPAKDLDLVKDAWRADQPGRQSHEKEFGRFFSRSVHEGFALVAPAASSARAFDAGAVAAASPRGTTVAAGKFALSLVPTVA